MVVCHLHTDDQASTHIHQLKSDISQNVGCHETDTFRGITDGAAEEKTEAECSRETEVRADRCQSWQRAAQQQSLSLLCSGLNRSSVQGSAAFLQALDLW